MWYYWNGCKGIFEMYVTLKCGELTENTCESIKEKIKLSKTLLVLEISRNN